MRAWGCRIAIVAAFAIALAAPPAAMALAPCSDPPATSRTLLTDQGTLESVIADPKGRLFFTSDAALMRLDSPDAEPKLLTPVPDPGGLAFDSDGSLLVGFGNTASNGSVGDATGPSGLLRVDPDTGESDVYATGLSMANGLARGPDGSFYASNDFGANIDRVHDGETERGWAHVQSGNGLAIDSEGRYLYVAQTFQPAAVQRIALDDPTDVAPYYVAGPDDVSAGLDGMTRDGADTLFVAANGAGQIWRIGADPVSACVLLDGLAGFPDGPSAVAVGGGHGFPRHNIYAVTFNGLVTEISDVAVPVPLPRIHLRARPRTAEAGDMTRFRFRATAGVAGRRTALENVAIHFAHEVELTNAKGRAEMTATFERPGLHRARARAFEYRRDRAAVRVRAG
jgi:sugar lactone lactonase YvrE